MNKEDKFKEFLKNNTRVEKEAVQICRDLKAKGCKKFGIDGVFAIVRYLRYIRTVDNHSDFKLHNDMKPYYARYLMKRYPDLAGFFDTKRLWTI